MKMGKEREKKKIEKENIERERSGMIGTTLCCNRHFSIPFLFSLP